MNQLEFGARLPQHLDMADNEKNSIKKYRFMDKRKEGHHLSEVPSERTLNFPFANPPLQRPHQTPSAKGRKGDGAKGRSSRPPHDFLPQQMFVGRERELSELLDALKPAHVVTLCGPAGIGKSALAAEAVWRLILNDSPPDDSPPDDSPPELFPDGIIYHDFSQEPQVTQVLSKIAHTFGEDPQRGTPATAAHRALAGRQALLVLDSTEKADDLAALLAVRGGCGVLMTSRQRKNALAKRLDLSPLQIDEAVDLLLHCSKPNPFVPREMILDIERARAICDLLGRWPFALCLAARDLQKADVRRYLPRLKQNILDTLDQGEEPLHSLPRFLAQSVEQLSPEAQQALAVVGMLANVPFSREVVANVLDMTVYQAVRLLGQLVNYGFLVRQKRQYKVTHRLIHTYAQQCLTLKHEQNNNKPRAPYQANIINFGRQLPPRIGGGRGLQG
jgi:hypothetical protein